MVVCNAPTGNTEEEAASEEAASEEAASEEAASEEAASEEAASEATSFRKAFKLCFNAVGNRAFRKGERRKAGDQDRLWQGKDVGMSYLQCCS